MRFFCSWILCSMSWLHLLVALFSCCAINLSWARIFSVNLHIGSPCALRNIGATGKCSLITDCWTAQRKLHHYNEKPQRCGFIKSLEVVCCEDNLLNGGDASTKRTERPPFFFPEQNGYDLDPFRETNLLEDPSLVNDLDNEIQDEDPHSAWKVFYQTNLHPTRLGNDIPQLYPGRLPEDYSPGNEYERPYNSVIYPSLHGPSNDYPGRHEGGGKQDEPGGKRNVTETPYGVGDHDKSDGNRNEIAEPGSKSEKACEEYAESCPLTPTPYIENGQRARLGEFPHMAVLGYETENGTDWDCGGTLISHQHILTAAHCIFNSQGKEPVVVRLGDLNLKDDDDGATPVDVEIAEFFPHPRYKPPRLYHDLAVISLKEPVKFNYNIHPACLHMKDSVPKETLTATGWGQTSFGGEKSDILMKVQLKHVPLRLCNTSFSSRLGRRLPSGLQKSMLCAGDPEGKKDACLGDSGGPLQYHLPDSKCMYSVLGVISTGIACASKTPGVYAKVSEHISWIESVVWR